MRYNTHPLKSVTPLYTGKYIDSRDLRNTSADPADKIAHRINELYQELKKLNFLEHPVKIVEISREIQKLKGL